MIAMTQFTPWLWAGFILCILFFLALDLGLFHRAARAVKFKEALAWTIFWFALAMLFAGGLALWRGREEAMQFTAGYIIELSLSLDNVLVMALIFAWFRVPLAFQHRLLFLGIIGAMIMRGAMIAAGVALIHEFEWVLYVFGAFLVFAGVKMVFAREEMVQPEKNLMLRLTRKLFPVTHDFDGPKFFSRMDGRLALTPLALVLVLIETTDLIFAVDSIPAVFSVTREAFIVFTSNVFAILGLRSLYFVLAGALGYFRYLKVGLSVVLLFVGAKMLFEPHGPSTHWFQVQISTGVSLLVVGAIFFLSIALSVAAACHEKKRGKNPR
jgi:TerC family integral membrane protein